MEEYKSNSYSSREEKKQLEKVVQGKVVTRKKSRLRRLADVFLAEDVGDIKSYLLYDILVPTIKDTVVKMVNNTVEMLAYGRIKAKPGDRPSYISYSSYSRPQAKPVTYQRVASSFDDIILETRGEAELVLDTLREFIDRYGQVTVRDFLDSVGMSGAGYTNYTQENFGWKDLNEAYVARVREGYLLVMPRVIQLS